MKVLHKICYFLCHSELVSESINCSGAIFRTKDTFERPVEVFI